MNAADFIHPDDATALQALKKVPILPTVMEKVLQYGYEEIDWSENITTNIRLSENQMPNIYKHLPPICQKLGIPVPELYLCKAPIVNAWTSGHNRIYITVTYALVRRFTEEELIAVLAHECGHILCQHVLYQTLANAIFNFGDSLMDSFLGQIGSTAMKPLRQALVAWSRASELSADRVATMITSADTVARMLAKVDGIPIPILKELNYDEWARQGQDYESLKDSGAWHKVVRWWTNSDMDHPYSPVRVYEAKRWENSGQCERLKNGIQLISDGLACPKCGAPISQDWLFCKKCGNKLK